jgi:transcription elongation factor GreA
LSAAEIIDPTSMPNSGKVIFGATVELEDQNDGKSISYQIVGEDEADIKSARISITSPIARALVGKSAGDVVDVTAPGGTHSYEIVKVSYV